MSRQVSGVSIRCFPPGRVQYCPRLARARHAAGGAIVGGDPTSRGFFVEEGAGHRRTPPASSSRPCGITASSSSLAQSVHRTYTARRWTIPQTNHAWKSPTMLPRPKLPSRTHDASIVSTRAFASYRASQSSRTAPMSGAHVASKRARSRRTIALSQNPGTASERPGVAARKGRGGRGGGDGRERQQRQRANARGPGTDALGRRAPGPGRQPERERMAGARARGVARRGGRSRRDCRMTIATSDRRIADRREQPATRLAAAAARAAQNRATTLRTIPRTALLTSPIVRPLPGHAPRPPLSRFTTSSWSRPSRVAGADHPSRRPPSRAPLAPSRRGRSRVGSRRLARPTRSPRRASRRPAAPAMVVAAASRASPLPAPAGLRPRSAAALSASLTLAKVAGAGYVGVCALMYVFQRKLQYFPAAGVPPTPPSRTARSAPRWRTSPCARPTARPCAGTTGPPPPAASTPR